MNSLREELLADLLRRILLQAQWMLDHGSTFEGYVKFYGSATDENHYGNGGEYIYNADRDALDALVEEFNRQGGGK